MDYEGIDLQILRIINEKSPHTRGLARLRIKGKRLDSVVRPLFSCYQYYFEYLKNMEYICVGADNRCYLTIEGGKRAGLLLKDIINPPDEKRQFLLFPRGAT